MTLRPEDFERTLLAISVYYFPFGILKSTQISRRKYPEVYLRPCQTSKMELFSENS